MTHTCPRHIETNRTGEAEWKLRDGQLCCTFCGSLHPDVFMQAVRDGVLIGPTDKNYKAYIDLPNRSRGKPTIYTSAYTDKDLSGEEYIKLRWWNFLFLPLRRVEKKSIFRKYVEHILFGDQLYTRWVKIEPAHGTVHHKFYYQHLSRMQRSEFVALLNEKKINIGYPGHFYSLPFFITE